MKTTEWCTNDNEKRRVKREQLLNSGGLGGRKLSHKLRGRTFSIGANKRILFVPDVKNITKLNDIYIKLQSFVTNDIHTKYRSVDNYSTIDYIFSKLSGDNSLVTFNTSDKKDTSVKKMCNGDIISLYDENEGKYLNKLIPQLLTRDDNLNYNYNESNISDGDIAEMIANKRNPLLELQSEIDYVVSHSYSNSNIMMNTINVSNSQKRLARDIAVKYETAVKNIDFSKHYLTQNDVKIDYNTWRLKIARNARREYYQSSPLRDMYCNHYYYHTLQYKIFRHSSTMNIPNRLDYNIEQDRKLFEYPKLYNIDYDCVEKAHKWHVANYVTLLKRLEEIHRGAGTHDWRHRRSIARLKRSHGIDKYDPHKDIYYSLYEFFHDCQYTEGDGGVVGHGYGNVWTGDNNKYGINRFVDNMEDYDLYTGVERDVGNRPVLLIGNIDRMYNIKLNRMVKKWYKNGKYLLYAILPQEEFEESSLSIDFCHFEIYYNRLKLLQSAISGGDRYSNYNYDILSKYVWIALNDCSRYCKDELHRQQKLCADEINNFNHAYQLLKLVFRNDNKATWDRRNKNKYTPISRQNMNN